MPYITLFKFQNQIYAACDEQGRISACEDKQVVLDSFEKPYMANHGRGYEASMSACYHFIFFQPKVVFIQGMQSLQDVIVQPFSIATCRTVAGVMVGATCAGPGSEALYESGTTPRLIQHRRPPTTQKHEEADASQLDMFPKRG